MTSFAFLKAEWPDVFEAAVKAESLVIPDPRTACFYARRALELAVGWAYKSDALLRVPYQDNISALIHDPSFKARAGDAVFTKARLIIKLGNQAVHSHRAIPESNYGLVDAVKDGFLVRARAVSVPLKFHREGIDYASLADEEKEQWDDIDWDDGATPNRVESAALNSWLFNKDTVDKVLEHLMTRGQKVAGGDRLGKTIVFAKNQKHAEFIAERFDANYPHYKGKFARVVHCDLPYVQSLIDDFGIEKKPPHIAISVDTLDTGIDIHEIVNLVFFKMVRSKTKFWQMGMNKALTQSDLDELERILAASGLGQPEDVEKAKEECHGLGPFVRSLIGLDRNAAKAAFAEFLKGSSFRGNQIEFIDLVINQLTEHGAMEPARLYESPFTDICPTGPDGIFTTVQLDTLIGIIEGVTAAAGVG